jgi:hypothetical protein
MKGVSPVTRSWHLGLLSIVAATAIFATPLQAAPAEDNFQVAQRHIYAAIAKLQDYMKEHPSGKNAATARLQLSGLQALSTFETQVKYTPMNSGYGPIDWGVVAVEARPDTTEITLRITNERTDGPCNLWGFDSYPLCIVDNLGQFYPSGEFSALPPGVELRHDGAGGHLWALQGGQSITVTVAFPPLQPSATGGKVMYKTNNPTQPAEFSLLHRQ